MISSSYLRVRGAGARDFKEIDRILNYYNFPNFDIDHLEMLVVVENDANEIVAVGSLSTVLEAVFVPAPETSRKEKIESLKLAVDTAKISVKNLGYNNFHALGVKIPTLARALVRRLGFQSMVGSHFIQFVK